MTTELTYLMLTAVLAASLWVPYIVGVNMQTGDGRPDFTRPGDPASLPPWVHRSWRAHLNLLEQMMPFAVIVLIAHVLEISTTVTSMAAVVFFWLRVAHAVGMISGLAGFPLRPIIFSAGWITILIFAWQVFASA